MKKINKNVKVLAVVGSQNFKDVRFVYSQIDAARVMWPNVNLIISGEEKTGVDAIAEQYAREKKIKFQGYPADWTDMAEPCYVKVNSRGHKYNALAGFKRNTTISEKTDAALAIRVNNSPGTSDTIKKVKAMGKPCEIVEVSR
jgi:hypothetical protein